MYLQFFGFSSPPFSDTPDVRLFWENHCSQVVFKSLLQGLTDQSLLQLVVAEPGLGKSVLCRRLLNSLKSHRSRYNVLYMAFPNLAISELLNSATSSAGGEQRNVLIIDEAQALPDKSLQELTDVLMQQQISKPDLQLVLFAQPELEQRLADPRFEATASMVSERYDLLPLSAEQTAAYITNRLSLTGVSPDALMHSDVADLAFRLTEGVPRLINTLMRKSLLHAFEDQNQRLNADHLRRAAQTTAASVPHVGD